MAVSHPQHPLLLNKDLKMTRWTVSYISVILSITTYNSISSTNKTDCHDITEIFIYRCPPVKLFIREHIYRCPPVKLFIRELIYRCPPVLFIYRFECILMKKSYLTIQI
jgi:hypothetical protein